MATISFALLVDRFLAEHEALARRPGGNQMQRRAVLAMRAARGLAVDRHNVGLLLAQAFHPIGEAFGKERGRQGVHHIVERVMGGDALLEGQETLQKVELLLGPALDLAEILGAGHCPAQDDQQDFRQGIDDLPSLARVLEGGWSWTSQASVIRGPL